MSANISLVLVSRMLARPCLQALQHPLTLLPLLTRTKHRLVLSKWKQQVLMCITAPPTTAAHTQPQPHQPMSGTPSQSLKPPPHPAALTNHAVAASQPAFSEKGTPATLVQHKAGSASAQHAAGSQRHMASVPAAACEQMMQVQKELQGDQAAALPSQPHLLSSSLPTLISTPPAAKEQHPLHLVRHASQAAAPSRKRPASPTSHSDPDLHHHQPQHKQAKGTQHSTDSERTTQPMDMELVDCFAS